MEEIDTTTIGGRLRAAIAFASRGMSQSAMTLIEQTEDEVNHLQTKLAEGQEKNKRLRETIKGALRIKSLWFHQSEKEEHQEESKALAAMLTSFEQVL